MDAVVPGTTLTSLLTDTDQQSPTRRCFLLRVQPGRLSEYVDAHQHVWPEMRQALADAGWRNYSLFLDPSTGTVVGYFEADNADEAEAAIARTETNTRWQHAMAQFFVQPDGGTNRVLPQYFYLA